MAAMFDNNFDLDAATTCCDEDWLRFYRIDETRSAVHDSLRARARAGRRVRARAGRHSGACGGGYCADHAAIKGQQKSIVQLQSRDNKNLRRNRNQGTKKSTA
jgi:hypothetical protein